MNWIAGSIRNKILAVFVLGIAMVVDVMAGPPQRALLHRGRSDEGPREPRETMHMKRPMREIPMERQGQTDGTYEVRDRPEQDQARREWHGKHEERRCLDDPEHALSDKRHG